MSIMRNNNLGDRIFFVNFIYYLNRISSFVSALLAVLKRAI